MTAYLGPGGMPMLFDEEAFRSHEEPWKPEIDVLVWLRSRRVSYSKELPRRYLQPDGKVTFPGLEEFTWEKWPEKPPR
jgi:hypothetical protein